MNAEHLRVTIIALNYSPEQTGIAPYTTDLANGLTQRGHTVRVITGYPHYPSWTIDQKYKGNRLLEEIGRVPVQRVRQYTPKSLNNLKRVALEFSFGIRAILENWHQPNIIVCTSPALLATMLITARAKLTRNGPAIGIWVQDIYSRGLAETSSTPKLATKLATKLESRILRSADGIVVIHDRFKIALNNGLSVDLMKITSIRNWTHIKLLKVNSIKKVRERLNWDENETVILHAGNMGVKQGLENVIQAAKISHNKKLPLRFVLLGDGNQRTKLQETCGDLPNLDFLDPMDDEDFQATLKAADILLVNELPGVIDMAVPSKLTTYFAMAKPILAATDSGSATSDEIKLSNAGRRVVTPENQSHCLI